MGVWHIMPDHELGGGGVMIARLLQAFDEIGEAGGHEALLPVNADPRMREVFAGLPHRIGAFPGRGSPVAMAADILRHARPGDVAHAHGSRAAMAASLAKLARPSLTVIYTVHGFHGLAQPGPLGMRRRIEHLLARRVDGTAFVSDSDAALAAEHGLRHRGPAEVIENGMRLPSPSPEAPRDVDVLFVGRLVYQKWPQAFIETVAALPRLEGRAPRVVMIGAGEMAQEVDALAERMGLENFTRHDGMALAETQAVMGRTKVLAMTSRWEGMPTVAMEAAIAGALVMGFDIPPLRSVVKPDGDALLTASEPAALAARLGGILADDAARVALAGPLQARTLERFAPERMARRYRALYDAAA
ncbi:glycosyltransferase family 4 protein [Albimonas pacifica]|uniref:Glycosyltransferase involved in cell wall bisynthesis n=1 Tax=Albimonas pacifica TaxID=1114924 RepID=A0A1I3CQX4_9RHOB|nr:glycosyltransferase family 4 protein [Albimonas pacifica]SFH76922.1 Glycosyltransferase involved in cell wall bisynthesis [Albimonas pacifica]